MLSPEEIDREISLIKERNRRVELDKAWETSWTRRLFIVALTYLFAGIWLVLIRDPFPWVKSLLPVIGYILSTLTIPILKKWWLVRRI